MAEVVGASQGCSEFDGAWPGICVRAQQDDATMLGWLCVIGGRGTFPRNPDPYLALVTPREVGLQPRLRAVRRPVKPRPGMGLGFFRQLRWPEYGKPIISGRGHRTLQVRTDLAGTARPFGEGLGQHEKEGGDGRDLPA